MPAFLQAFAHDVRNPSDVHGNGNVWGFFIKERGYSASS